MKEYSVYVGLDAHKDSIAVVTAASGRDAPQYRGEIANTPTALRVNTAISSCLLPCVD